MVVLLLLHTSEGYIPDIHLPSHAFPHMELAYKTNSSYSLLRCQLPEVKSWQIKNKYENWVHGKKLQ